VVVGPVGRGKPVFVEDLRFLRRQTRRPIKLSLPGPMTMVDTLYDSHYKSREKLAREFAAILNQEARELERGGRRRHSVRRAGVQRLHGRSRRLGHPGAGSGRGGPRVQDRRAHLLRLRYQGERRLEENPRFGVAAVRVHLSLLARSKIDQVSLECANSHVPMELLALLKGKDVMVGAIDVANDTVEKPSKWRDDPLGHEIRPAGKALSVHQLRYGAARARGRARQAEGPRRGGRARATGNRLPRISPT